jgi:hypothetical protein
MTPTLHYNLSRDLPILADCDVLVAGGGPGGLGAAVMAARAGARTVLVERYGFLGGMAASGEISPFMPNHSGGRSLDHPVYAEWVARMYSYLPEDARTKHSGNVDEDWVPPLSKDAAMLAAEDLCMAAGVRLLYHHWVADVICEEHEKRRRIDAVVLVSKSGYSAARAKVFVDCTGDGDLAALAGCECEMGGPSGHCQPMTLCFKLSHIDIPALHAWGAPNWRGKITELYLEAKKNGQIHCPREDVLVFDDLEEDVLHFNTTRVVQKAGTDGVALGEAEIEARLQMREYLHFLRRAVPAFARARIHSMAHHIGVRETRRVRGLAYLTREDFRARAKFDDAIARCNYPIDIHNPVGSGTEHEHMPDTEWYEIPYGCVVARDVDNLTVGGRPISVDHAVHSSARVMPPAVSVGQAAGLAAAMAALGGKMPGELDGCEVRRRLVEAGANL